MTLDSKHSEASFSPNSLCLRIAKTPRCQDLAIFFVDNSDNDMDDNNIMMIEPITLPLAHTCRIIMNIDVSCVVFNETLIL